MSLIQRWDDPSLLAARRFTREIKDQRNSMSPDDIRGRISSDSGLRESVVLVFNYFDYIRLSLKMGRIDKGIIQESLGDIGSVNYENPDYDNRAFDLIDSITREDIDELSNQIFAGKPIYSIVASKETLYYNKEYLDSLVS